MAAVEEAAQEALGAMEDLVVLEEMHGTEVLHKTAVQAVLRLVVRAVQVVLDKKGVVLESQEVAEAELRLDVVRTLN